ncbi:CPBP family glutamic-type intramembrane protease [Arthrobacter globiformis]|uniref:CPBP family glutamic-type intramembrane protease n=1 Tax=Arthrobacter globiformis TaxID=1665 RepID=UPI001C0EA92F|nr:CPBP family glutamic-type intramembrane protease [Arthrobacter globiformis]
MIAAMFSLALLDLTVYGVVIPASALLLAILTGPSLWHGTTIDALDLAVVAGLYLAVVVLFRVAFTVFTVANVLGLFLCFGTGLVLGVAVPVVYTLRRGRYLSDLGLGLGNWKQAVVLGLILTSIQFAITLFGYALPAPADWVPLLVMSLTVGAFETVFFRGFVQTRLCASLGQAPGIAIAAALYAAYHVGYGMDVQGMVFLFGLGVVYAIAFAVVRNVLVLWPLLTPLGSFFNNLNGGDIELPWEAILGFADVLALMVASVLLGRRWLKRRNREQTAAALPGRSPGAA